MLEKIYYFFSNILIQHKKSEDNNGIVWSRKSEKYNAMAKKTNNAMAKKTNNAMAKKG